MPLPGRVVAVGAASMVLLLAVLGGSGVFTSAPTSTDAIGKSVSIVTHSGIPFSSACGNQNKGHCRHAASDPKVPADTTTTAAASQPGLGPTSGRGRSGGGTTTTTATPTTTPTTTTPTTTPTTTTPTTTPTITVPTQPLTPGSWWQPGAGAIRWQWEIDHPLSLTNATDMGTNDTLPDGSPAPAPTVYDIDAVLNPASTVAGLHALGDKAICYIEVGTAGNYYNAAEEGVSTTYYAQLSAAGDLGGSLSGYPESFIDINQPSAVAIVEAMIQQQCAAKGFDGVETDLDETFGGNEGATPWTITQAQEVTYLDTLANYMHGLGLEWTAKNPDDTGSASFADAIEPEADSVITEQCNQYGTCGYLDSFLYGGKAVFNAEYSVATSTFCPLDIAAGINGAEFPESLNGSRSPCQ